MGRSCSKLDGASPTLICRRLEASGADARTVAVRGTDTGADKGVVDRLEAGVHSSLDGLEGDPDTEHELDRRSEHGPGDEILVRKAKEVDT